MRTASKVLIVLTNRLWPKKDVINTLKPNLVF